MSFGRHLLGLQNTDGFGAVVTRGLWIALVAVIGLLLTGCEQLKLASSSMEGGKPGESRVLAIGHGLECEFRWVPAGKLEAKGTSPVEIANGFWIGADLVTESDWQRVMGKPPSFRPNPPVKNPSSANPEARVSWHDSQEFLGRLISPDPDWKYELLDVAEWEFACRAGSVPVAGGFPEYGAKSSPGNGGNAWSIRNMRSNAGEWCRDSVSPEIGKFAGPRKAGAGLALQRFSKIGFRIALVRRQPSHPESLAPASGSLPSELSDSAANRR